jgi:probable rRNA maturation factor
VIYLANRTRGAGLDTRAFANVLERLLAEIGERGTSVSLTFVRDAEMRELNREHRGKDAPTDVLAFPVDGTVAVAGPRELGDVAICPEHCADVTEAAVHGVLHLCGRDHEVDDGEMLAEQERILAALR